jgi:diguanylate cyclase (GGDEF)-like protein/PAS domain S-box-containing protein
MKAPSTPEGMAIADAQLVAGLIEGMLDAVWLVDADSLRIVAANGRAGELLGCQAASLCGREVIELCATPEDLCFWNEAAAGLSDAIESETWVRRFDGVTLPVTRRVARLLLANASRTYLVVLHDRSAQRHAERMLEERVAELGATLESTADGLLVTDLAGNIRSFNRTFAALWAVPGDLLSRRDDDALFDFMRRRAADPAGYMRRLAALEEGELREAVDSVVLDSGRALQRISMPQTSHGRCIGRVYSFRDVTERLEAIHRLDTLTHSDLLTGLPNRAVLADRVKFSIALAQRDGTPFALLLTNLDRFKHINDTLGHDLGDQVLADVAERLKGCLRQVDTVTRLGGDEFVMLIHQADALGAEAAARRVLDALQRPFSRGELSFTVTCSIGIALYPGDGQNLEQLVRHADAAMHEVKEAGRAAYRFHQAHERGDEAGSRGRLELDSAMREALACGRFRLHYQPQVDMASGKVLGAEALIRWHDPVLGQVPPAEFIPVAEQSGFIIAIGDWVLRQAVQQAATWHAQGRGLVVSVNVSAVQFHRAGFVDRVAQVIQAVQLPPELLELELTESILIQDAKEALVRLQALSQLGVKLAIDDFGTGYSSLGYLKRFPIDRLKIDRSFVSGLPGDQSDVGIVNAIVNLGRALHLEIVAEGVETEAQREFLARTGCEQYQGFLFAPALDSASFEARLVEPEPPELVD